MTRDGSPAPAVEGEMNATPSPKDRFTSLDTLAVSRELRALDRGRVDKAFDLPEGGWSLSLRVPGEGRRELLLVPGRYAALVASAPPHTEELSPLAKELRRLLTGAVLREVAEPSGERYLEVAFSRTDVPEGLLLALEMFGKGNLVVVRGTRIAAVAEVRRWAHRTVRIGADYARPPVRSDPLTMSVGEITSVLEQSRNDLASTLAARLSLGGPVAEELIARGGWTPETAAASRASEIAPGLQGALAALVEEIGPHPQGYLYVSGGVPVDATPYPSRRWSSHEEVEVTALPTFSEAAHAYFRTLVTRAPTLEESESTRAREELERLVARQRSAVEELADAAAERKADADAVLAHYVEATEAIAGARNGGSNRTTVEVTLGDRPVVLDLALTPRESAQAMYEEAKRIGSKLEGARAALAESLARSQPAVSARSTTSSPVTTRPSRTFWFEKFRWFVSSEGTVVIAGRDAPSNDLIVRRNLKAGDVYVHADIHGAASVVVKRTQGASSIGAATLEEAAQWAVSYSKAWRAGLASASAFWVTPEQVSKAAATGEFVPRGAWVIHGTKNFFRDLPLELAVGTVQYEGEERWTAAPERSVRARGSVRALLVPGEERDRPDLERSLSAELGISRSLLQSLLPAGGVAVRRA
jgi:predicted ribosome quality control (RQC) complex YloA/Tae2 family protein